MNVSAFYIYMIDVADSIKTISVGASIIIFIFAFITGLENCLFRDESVAKCTRKMWVALAIFLAVAVLVPSGKTLVACKVVPAIAKSEVVNEIPQALLKFIRKYTEEN